MYSSGVTQIRVLGVGYGGWFANKNSSSAVQYMPDEILDPNNYRKYKDRQNR